MGIINTTPDSFYEGSRFMFVDQILRQAERMLKDGADILDIGGQSTRPGSDRLPISEEKERVLPSIEALNMHFPEAIISIDTFHAAVASEAVNAGASIVNDISGGNFDNDMLATVGSLGVPYVCMHTKGTPQDMQEHAQYDDICRELLDYFIKKIEDCRKAGISDVIIDPGFGFAKNIRHNFELLRNLTVFHMLDCPVMAGLSRKSTIYKTLGTDAAGALNGTTVMNTVAILNGANILRVHDVKEAKEAVILISEMNQSGK
ncbi:MAG TPA: dihydropteroate synthase [Chitinophagaceae bacterium]